MGTSAGRAHNLRVSRTQRGITRDSTNWPGTHRKVNLKKKLTFWTQHDPMPKEKRDACSSTRRTDAGRGSRRYSGRQGGCATCSACRCGHGRFAGLRYSAEGRHGQRGAEAQCDRHRPDGHAPRCDQATKWMLRHRSPFPYRRSPRPSEPVGTTLDPSAVAWFSYQPNGRRRRSVSAIRGPGARPGV
jgi:hypothetical protein